MADKKKIALLGAGTMGIGIAQMFAQAGHEVKLIYVYDDKVRARPRKTMEANLNILREEGVQDGGAIPAILDRVSWTESLEEAAAFADVVIECIVEDLAVKQDYFQKLDALCPLSTVLTTNTSAISVTEIAGKAVHKERIIGTHFWNPAYLVPLVEVIRSRGCGRRHQVRIRYAPGGLWPHGGDRPRRAGPHLLHSQVLISPH